MTLANPFLDAPVRRTQRMYAVMSMQAMTLMNGVRGKMITQGGHAYLHAYWDAWDRFHDDAVAFRDQNHARKITVKVETTEELLPIMWRYRPVCGVSLVTDAGFTVFAEPTITCLGIGPIWDDEIGDDLKGLKLL